MRSHSETSLHGQADGTTVWDEFWLVEVVNCTVVADLGPLDEADLGSSLKIDDSHEMGLGGTSTAVGEQGEPGLSRPEQRRRGIT
jgi:hypothetical protein